MSSLIYCVALSNPKVTRHESFLYIHLPSCGIAYHRLYCSLSYGLLSIQILAHRHYLHMNWYFSLQVFRHSHEWASFPLVLLVLKNKNRSTSQSKGLEEITQTTRMLPLKAMGVVFRPTWVATYYACVGTISIINQYYDGRKFPVKFLFLS